MTQAQARSNARFSEEERAEAYRVEHMAQVVRQTRALEATRTYVAWLLGVVAFGLLALVMVALVVPYL